MGAFCISLKLGVEQERGSSLFNLQYASNDANLGNNANKVGTTIQR